MTGEELSPREAWRSWGLPAVVAAAVFLVGEIPYAAGRAASPPEHRFLGLLCWPDDLNMYFSFARQAADGHWLFENRLTHLPHGKVFFNPGFLAVGRLMRWGGLEDTTAFAIWRAGGVAALVAGFVALCRSLRVPPAQRTLALLVFALGGGLGWLAVLLGIEGLRLDLRSGFQPFAQMLLNPHFSLPHGLLLASLALFLRGERSGRVGWYLAAGGLVLVEILIRPYDLLTLWIAVPAFVVLARPRTVRTTLLRALPLVFTLPAAVYFFFLFRMHPVFRHWASQGRMELVSITEQVACLGVMALVAAWRLARWRALPLTSAERFLLAWLAAEIGIVHLARFSSWFPFSPQVGFPVMAPLVLLALPALPTGSWRGLEWPARAAVAGLVVVNSLGSGVLLHQRTAIVTTQTNYYHIRTAALEAFGWLGAHARADDVILADYIEGNRLGRFVSAHVVLGHYSVTPNAAGVETGVKGLMSGRLGGEEAGRLLEAWGVRWVYYSPMRYPGAALDGVPQCSRRYRRRGIAIYECGAALDTAHARHAKKGATPSGTGSPIASGISEGERLSAHVMIREIAYSTGAAECCAADAHPNAASRPGEPAADPGAVPRAAQAGRQIGLCEDRGGHGPNLRAAQVSQSLPGSRVRHRREGSVVAERVRVRSR